MARIKKQKSPQVTTLTQAKNWRRLVAFFIDFLIIAIPNSAIILLLSDNGLYTHISFFYGFFLAAVTFGYFLFLTKTNNGQTFGKMLMRIRVVSWKGKLGLRSIIVRYVFLFTLIQFDGLYHILTGQTLSLFGVVLQFLAMLLVLCLLLIDDKRRGIHDMLAGTWVVRV